MLLLWHLFWFSLCLIPLWGLTSLTDALHTRRRLRPRIARRRLT